MMPRVFCCTTVLALALLGGCAPRTDTASDSPPGPASAAPAPYAYAHLPLDTTRTPGTIIDSVFPMPEMLRRFRDSLPATATLLHAAPTRDALLRSFIAALAASDRVMLGHLALSRAEFAYVYFPNVADTTSDVTLSPQRRWDQLTLNSEKGVRRALTRLGGNALTLQSYNCPNAPVVRGTLRMHEGCTVRLTESGTGATAFSGHLFGTIVEQAGRYKFAGYSNDM